MAIRWCLLDLDRAYWIAPSGSFPVYRMVAPKRHLATAWHHHPINSRHLSIKWARRTVYHSCKNELSVVLKMVFLRQALLYSEELHSSQVPRTNLLCDRTDAADRTCIGNACHSISDSSTDIYCKFKRLGSIIYELVVCAQNIIPTKAKFT